MRMFSATALALTVIPCLALAAPVPADVDAMIREAAKSSDLDAVVKIAKATNPNSVTEIDALVASLKKEAEATKEAKLARAGLWDAWSGSGQLGASHTSGNTDDTDITASLDLTKDGLAFRHKLHGFIDRQTSDGVLSSNKYLATYELDYKFNTRLYLYGTGGWDKDTFAGVDQRFSESAGVGYSLFTGPRMKLDLTAGPAFRQTTFIGLPSENVTTVRAALDYSWKIFSALTFSEQAEIFVADQIRSTTALTVPVRKAISARLSFDVTEQDKVPPGHEKTDTATRMTVVFSF